MTDHPRSGPTDGPTEPSPDEGHTGAVENPAGAAENSTGATDASPNGDPTPATENPTDTAETPAAPGPRNRAADLITTSSGPIDEDTFWVSDPRILADIDQLSEKLRALGPCATSREAGLRLRWLEDLAASIAAAQAKAAVDLHTHRVNEDAKNNLPKRQHGVCAGDEIALARRLSPAAGRRYLSTARTLVNDLPKTLDALADGIIPEPRAKAVADATHDLTPDQRRSVDTQIAPVLPELGTRQVTTHAKALAAEITANTAADRAQAAAKDRHVRIRMGEEGMGTVSATLPALQAVAVADSLRQAAAALKTAGDPQGRTEPQLMADLFVQRLTGQDDAAAVPVEVNVIIDTGSLIADGSTPAWLPGHGPLPARTLREHLVNTDAEVFIRRLFTTPETGQLVGMESRSRRFTGLLRQMVVFRDDVCRTPWCDAPIKHVDHVTPVASGGETSWENASGLCASCNYVKEHPGWRHEASGGSLRVLTPSGACIEADVHPVLRRIQPKSRLWRRRERKRPEWGNLPPPFPPATTTATSSNRETTSGRSPGGETPGKGHSSNGPPGDVASDKVVVDAVRTVNGGIVTIGTTSDHPRQGSASGDPPFVDRGILDDSDTENRGRHLLRVDAPCIRRRRVRRGHRSQVEFLFGKRLVEHTM